MLAALIRRQGQHQTCRTARVVGRRLLATAKTSPLQLRSHQQTELYRLCPCGLCRPTLALAAWAAPPLQAPPPRTQSASPLARCAAASGSNALLIQPSSLAEFVAHCQLSTPHAVHV